MIKILEIIIFPSVTQKNVDEEFQKWGIMVLHSKIRPMRYELTKWSNKFHASRTERVSTNRCSSSWMQKMPRKYAPPFINSVLVSFGLLWCFLSFHLLSLSLSVFCPFSLAFSLCHSQLRSKQQYWLYHCTCQQTAFVYSQCLWINVHHSHFSRLRAQFKEEEKTRRFHSATTQLYIHAHNWEIY